MGGPAQPTLNDLLDHWLAHLQANKAVRLRTVGRYRQLTEHLDFPPLAGHRGYAARGDGRRWS